MLQRIRQAFVQNPTEKFDSVVEVDETYVGGKNKNRHRNKKVKHSQGRSTKTKHLCLAFCNVTERSLLRLSRM